MKLSEAYPPRGSGSFDFEYGPYCLNNTYPTTVEGLRAEIDRLRDENNSLNQLRLKVFEKKYNKRKYG